MKYRDVVRRLEALEQQAQPERGYVVVIDADSSSIVTVDGVEMTLAEYARRYPDAEMINIGGLGDAT